MLHIIKRHDSHSRPHDRAWSVVVDGARIAAVGPADRRRPCGRSRMDAEGRILVPG